MRDAATTEAILVAAMDLLAERGLAAFTIERLAAKAGVSKATIYRWWPSRGAVALDALLATVEPQVPFPAEGDFEAVIRDQVTSLVRIFRDDPAGDVIRALIAESQADPDLAAGFRERWLEPRRVAGRAVFRRAQEIGELRTDLDIETAIDLIYGPVYFRLLVGHEPLSDSFAADITAYAMRGLRP